MTSSALWYHIDRPSCEMRSGSNRLELGVDTRKKSEPSCTRLTSTSGLLPVTSPNTKALAAVLSVSTTSKPSRLIKPPPTNAASTAVDPLAAPLMSRISAAVPEKSTARVESPEPTKSLSIVSTSPVAPSCRSMRP